MPRSRLSLSLQSKKRLPNKKRKNNLPTMNNLITVEEIRLYGRQIGKAVSNDKITAYIEEAEQLHIKPIIGNALYPRLIRYIDNGTGEEPLLDTLLDGGIYEYPSCDCGGEEKEEAYVNGLRKAIAYFVYAQNVMVGDFESTRFGMVTKVNDYSEHLSDKNRNECYNNALDMANGYLQECVAYCKAVGLMKRVGTPKSHFEGATIKRIG